MTEEPGKIAKASPREYEPESGQPGASRTDEEPAGKGQAHRVPADECSGPWRGQRADLRIEPC
jgi:hypothetical protein